MNEAGVRMTVNFIGTNFWVIACTPSVTLFFAMGITMALHTNCEIEIAIAKHAPALPQHLPKQFLSYCHFDFIILSLSLQPCSSFLSSNLFFFLWLQQYFYSTPMIRMGLVQFSLTSAHPQMWISLHDLLRFS